jgi:hypothetical protein
MIVRLVCFFLTFLLAAVPEEKASRVRSRLVVRTKGEAQEAE